METEKSRNPRLICNCTQCDKEFSRVLSQFNKSKNHFCSKSCAATFNNKGRNRHRNKIKENVCKKCNVLIKSSRKYCDICLAKIRPPLIKEHKCHFCEKVFSKTGKKDYKFCTFECSTKFRKKTTYEKEITLFEKGNLIYRKRIRPLLIERDGYKCKICKNFDWYGNKIPLQVDHIDGNASNNNPKNLRLICHNCDACLPTFSGRNRGFGRKSRGLSKYA